MIRQAIVVLLVVAAVIAAMLLLIGCAGLASTGAVLGGMEHPAPYYYPASAPSYEQPDPNRRQVVICTNNGSTLFCRE